MHDYFYGKSSRYGVGADQYCGKGWSVDPTVDELRTDNTCAGGYSDRIAGVNNITFTIEQDWDASQNPFDDPPGLKAGTVLADLSLFLDADSDEDGGPFWDMPKAIILGTPMTAMVDALVHITANGANKGIFNSPTGSFTPSAPGEPYEPA